MLPTQKSAFTKPKRLSEIPRTVDEFCRATSGSASAALNERACQILSTPVRLIPITAVCEIVGLKESAVRDKVASGDLPQPVKFGEGRRAAARWIEQEIYQYVWALAAARPHSATGASKPNQAEAAM